MMLPFSLFIIKFFPGLTCGCFLTTGQKKAFKKGQTTEHEFTILIICFYLYHVITHGSREDHIGKKTGIVSRTERHLHKTLPVAENIELGKLDV